MNFIIRRYFSSNVIKIKNNYNNETKEIKIGEISSLKRTFTADDVKIFAKLTGDNNPIHLDPDYASKTRFKRNIVHGALAASLFSTIIADQLTGHGSIYISQVNNFQKPIYVGDPIRAEIKVLGITGKKIQLETTIYNIDTQNAGQETIAIQGPAVVYHPDIIS
ncbi:hypothetical protein DLAC_04408 [Tieghemostelium lacteum]|uniref:MaoC-like domain-containing protein n=1 Tax=Tieghemostelium lacteum TaxID=361077 RepID=A0A151ZJM6_TIELA|nr:hypothetical protein DLAC_04408 [Tieghemostelium lacteum]|eukprot:KYQ94127.1 hypothetical protein DLAC_04408 [Tieghemostelium lacteum]